MPCYSPIEIKKYTYGQTGPHSVGRVLRYRQVPCGHCLGCLRSRQMQYAFRLEWEALDPRNKQILFCTFTYSDEYLPTDNELSKLEIQHYVRRLRKSIPGVECRYFFCGEHGDLRNRAHYHAILYFSDFVPLSKIVDAWPFGIVDIREASLQRFGYVAKYSVKQLGDDSDRWFQPPFMLISNSVGFYFLEKHGDFCRKNYINSWMNASGYLVNLPRVFMERLFPALDKVHIDKEICSPAASVYYRSFVGSKVVLDLKRRASYDARVSLEAFKKGLGVAAFEGFCSLGQEFLHENKKQSIFSRVRYETGRY